MELVDRKIYVSTFPDLELEWRLKNLLYCTDMPNQDMAIAKHTGSFDVLFYDDVGMWFDDTVVDQQALGGSEFVLWQLAREMGKRGLRVLVWLRAGNPVERETSFGNVTYRLGAGTRPVSTRCVIHHRYSSRAYETTTRWDRRWVLCSDLWGDHYERSLSELAGSMEGIVCVSRWQASLFPLPWTCHVIPNPIPEESYAPVVSSRSRDTFLYASAALKGLGSTLEIWQSIRRKHPNMHGARLRVLSPGYDNPSMAANNDGVDLVGSVPFATVLEEMRHAAGIFYVNDYPETFCLVAALAEACGARVHIWMRNGGAISETVNSSLVTDDGARFEADFVSLYRGDSGAGCAVPNDFRINHVVDKWLELLQLV